MHSVRYTVDLHTPLWDPRCGLVELQLLDHERPDTKLCFCLTAYLFGSDFNLLCVQTYFAALSHNTHNTATVYHYTYITAHFSVQNITIHTGPIPSLLLL